MLPYHPTQTLENYMPVRGPPAKLTPSSFAYGCLLGEGAYGRVIHARLHSNGKLGTTDYAIKMIEKRVVQRENKVRGIALVLG